MAKRRCNREGAIYQRGDGKWRAQVTLDGRRLSFSAKTRRECLEWFKKTNGLIDDGMTYASTKVTFEEFITGWLSSSKASIKRTTWTHYNQVMHSYVIPFIGHVKVKDLRPDQIQGLYDQLLAQGGGTYTVIKIHTVLRSALSQAVKTGMIGRNPASVTKPPKAPFREMKIYDESQVNQMLVSSKNNRLDALYHFAVTTGMRQIELLGLKWADLNWKNQTIKIERQLVRPDGRGIQSAPPKTKFGRRILTLGTRTIEVLKCHKKHQQSEVQSAGDRWIEHDLIFPNTLGNPIHPRNLLRDFYQLLRDAGLPKIRFHDLRHTSASLMLNHGVPLIVVCRRLGHSKPSITLDVYGHLIPGTQLEAAEKIDDLVTPIKLHPIAPETNPRINIEA